MATEELLAPNYGKLEVAFRSIGYSFETAVADVIDNSIDARASQILVRLIVTTSKQVDIAIWDNGSGMDDGGLKEAMRFGADVTSEIDRLGKFGLGLKLASLSQARAFYVVSRRGQTRCGRAWLEHGISSGFKCTIYDDAECQSILSKTVPDRVDDGSGTLVWWSNLYRVGHNEARQDENVQKLMRRLQNSLALAFHRFLRNGPRKVELTVDIFDQGDGVAGIPLLLDPLDPFDYEQSGRPGFPAPMLMGDGLENEISIKAHIWPPNSVSPCYRLPGGPNSRQGFYFFRNDRLIQGGGWNGLREEEPHASLARLEVDLNPDMDVEVSLDVKKVEIQLPPSLGASIQKAKTAGGVDLRKFVSLAVDTYRKRKLVNAELPLIPSQGLPAPLAKFLHQELRIKATTKHRDLKFTWKPLADDQFFDLDRDNGYLHLNSQFRRALMHGLPGSSADVPVFKCLLFLVAEDALMSERMSPQMRERLERLNRILLYAVKFERQE